MNPSQDDSSTHCADDRSKKDPSSFVTAQQALLYSSDHQAKTTKEIQASAARRTHTISDMRIYMERIGIFGQQSSVDPVTPFPGVLSHIPMIHITGTKGKGSTAAMCESILRRRHGLRTALFTSPHLCHICERIRINGRPISPNVFGTVYWYIRQQLERYHYYHSEETTNKRGKTNTIMDQDTQNELPILPGYFRMLTLMALVTFATYHPPIDVMILEVGMGGRYDATNVLDIITNNITNKWCGGVVAGVTMIDLDHTRILGSTREQIAWEKGGIFQVHKGDNRSSGSMTPQPDTESKYVTGEDHPYDASHTQEETGATKYEDEDARIKTNEPKDGRVFFVLDTNTPGVINVLRACAFNEGLGGTIQLVPKEKGPRLSSDDPIGLPGKHQRKNAELAIAMCERILELMIHKARLDDGSKIGELVKDMGIEEMKQAIAEVSWPGRGQIIDMGSVKPDYRQPATKLYLDGAHTLESISAGCEWFLDEIKKGTRRVLLFSCSHERNPVELLQQLIRCDFDLVIFARSDVERPSAITKQTAKELLNEAGLILRQDVVADVLTKADGTIDEPTTWQATLAIVWKHLEKERTPNMSPVPTIYGINVTEALDRIQTPGPVRFKKIDGTAVFVTGSLYLVGSALSAVGWKEEADDGTCNLR